MAAILCKALAQPCVLLARGCDACCRGLSSACSGLGKCCDSCCRCMGQACDGLCKALGSLCNTICGFFDKPFSGFVFVTLLANLIPFAVILAIAAKQFSNSCSEKSLGTWLIICLIIFIINALFACYLWSRLSNAPPPIIQGPNGPVINNNNDNAGLPPYDPNVSYERNQFKRNMHFFMYDPVVCVYIVFACFAFAWALVGLSWARADNVCNLTDNSDLVGCVTAGAIVLICFIVGAFIVIICTLASSYVTICLEDCSLLTCLCCCIYYPFMYNAETARQRYQQRHPQQPLLQQQQQQQHVQHVVVAIPSQPQPQVQYAQPQQQVMYQQQSSPQYQSQPAYSPQYQPIQQQQQQQQQQPYHQQPQLHYQQPQSQPVYQQQQPVAMPVASPTPSSSSDAPPPYATPAFQPGMSNPYQSPTYAQQQPTYAQPVQQSSQGVGGPGGPQSEQHQQQQQSQPQSLASNVASAAGSALKSGFNSLTTMVNNARKSSQQPSQQQQHR